MPPSDFMIRALGLTRRFGALTALDGLHLEIPRGEIFGLVGPDGAGKTTALRLLCGLLDPSEGVAEVAGSVVSRAPDRVKEHLGYMPQHFGLYPDLTVNENLAFFSDLYGISRAERATRTPRLMRMTRMEPFGDRPAGRLSGGMKQKLALMCTLLHQPDVLLLDEPTNGVDPVSRRDFWAILYQLVRDGITVLVTTAYLDEAERCNRVGFLAGGRLVRCDDPRVLKRELAGDCFEVEAAEVRAARDCLRAQPGVFSVEASGAVLHVLLRRGETSPALLEAALAAAGVPARPFRPLEPSLEDVFLALAKKEAA
jgi:ABC-2 type transport system ATP-binding protein